MGERIRQKYDVKGARAKALTTWEKKVEHFSRCRAHVYQAVKDIHGKRSNGDLKFFAEDENNTWLGPTYVEIRLWIHEHYRYWLENVGARCREGYNLDHIRKESEENGRVHVFPM